MKRESTPWVIVFSLWWYRWLLTLAPESFAREYTEPALQVFRQCCQDAYRQQGFCGVLCLWFPTFMDALVGILAEQGTVLRQVLRPRRVWPLVLALACVLFPFSWLSKVWQPFGMLFHLVFAMPLIYFTGHVALFCVAGLMILHLIPALRQHTSLYVLALMSGAFLEEFIQLLVNAHPGLHKDGMNFLLDFGGILAGYGLWRIWQRWCSWRWTL